MDRARIPKDLPRYYATADIFCSPATGQESFGIVLLEAMASGVAIAASDIPGYRTIVNTAREGILVPPRDPGELARAIVALARDEKLRREFGAAGRKQALRYDWPIVARRLESVYRDTLDERGAGRDSKTIDFTRVCP